MVEGVGQEGAGQGALSGGEEEEEEEKEEKEERLVLVGGPEEVLRPPLWFDQRPVGPAHFDRAAASNLDRSPSRGSSRAAAAMECYWSNIHVLVKRSHTGQKST